MDATFRSFRYHAALLALLALPPAALAQVPQLLNYEGRIAVNGTNFTGTGQFKFALVDGSVRTLWSNDGRSTNGSQPTASVGLPVTKGLYSVLLGDTTQVNMAALPATVFTNGTVLLRVWFNDGVSGFQQLTSDQRLAAVGYAIMAGTVPDGSITAAKLAPGAAGALNYEMANTANLQAVQNYGYMFTNAGAKEVHLPANPAIGDRVRLAANSGGFTIIANSGQSIMDPPSFGWVPRSPSSLGPRSVASSSDGSKLVAATGPVLSGGYIYTSSNYGVTWTQQTNSGTPKWISVASSSDGSRLVAAAGQNFIDFVNNYIYTSSDYGVTWTQQTNAGTHNWMSVASSSDGSRLVAVAGQNNPYEYIYDYIYTSSDYGATWTQQTNSGTRNWISVASSSDGSKLVAVAGANLIDNSYDYIYNDYIYTSTDYGATWMQQTNAGSRGWSSVASSSDGSKLVVAARGIWSSDRIPDYIYTSTNYGVTWMQQTNAGSNNWISVASSSDGRKLVAAVNGDYIYTSTDYGVTWTQQLNAGSRGWTSVASSSDGNKVVAGASRDSLYTMPNYITQWSTVYVYGAAYANIELVYTGGGLWIPTSYSGNFTIQ